MITLVIGLFLFVIPLFTCRTWDDGVRTPKEFLSILGLLTISFMVTRFYKMRQFNQKWLLLFGVWCFSTLLFNQYTIPLRFDNFVLDTPITLFAWKELFYILTSIMAIYCLGSFVIEGEKTLELPTLEIRLKEESMANVIKLLAMIISIVIIILSIYSLIQAVGLDEFFRVTDVGTGWVAQHPLSPDKDQIGAFSRRIVATLGNPSILGIFLALCLPLCLYIKRKLGYIAFILGLIIIGLTKSATAYGGAVLGIFLYLLFNYKKTLLTLLILSLPLAFYVGNHTPQLKHFLNPVGRIEVHKESFKILKEKAITGLGLGSFEMLIGENPDVVNKLGGMNWREMHDEIGQIWWSVGLIGLGMFLLFIGACIKRFLKKITPESSCLFASLIAFLGMSLFYFTFRVSPISFYGVILLGLFLNTTEGGR